MKIATYETDLTDAQWEFLQPMLAEQLNRRGRPRTDRRTILNAILYVLKGGIPWRLMPKNFPPWQTVYHVYRQWSLNHTWAALNDALRSCVRLSQGRNTQPSAAILDSQSVKSDGHGGEVGYDAGKKVKGRKRHILVDAAGLLLGVAVTPADCPEREGAKAVLGRVANWFTELRRLWVDGGYTGAAFEEWVREHWPNLKVEVVRRGEQSKGFAVLPHRWVVERTFGWLMRHRRLARDYERSTWSAEAWIHLAMIRIQIRRLA